MNCIKTIIKIGIKKFKKCISPFVILKLTKDIGNINKIKLRAINKFDLISIETAVTVNINNIVKYKFLFPVTQYKTTITNRKHAIVT